MEKSINVGEEDDDAMLDRVVKVLQDMGAQHVSTDRVMGGSQDLQTLRVDLDGQTIVVEAETYIGITVTGNDVLVDEIASRLATPADTGLR